MHVMFSSTTRSGMKKKLLAIGAALAFVLPAGACGQSDPGINGTVVNKYIEDFSEYTIVMMADNGDVHHFTIDDDQWRTFTPNSQGVYGQRVNSNNLISPPEDD